MSTLKVDNLQTVTGLNVDTIKAWANIGGIGTVAIRGSDNVSSITDGGVGVYWHNFSYTFPNANWAACADGRRNADVPGGEASPNTAVSNRSTINGLVGTYDNDTNTAQDSETVLFICVY